MTPRPAELPFRPAVREWFFQTFPAPTKAQRLGWPAIARGESALVFAPTGSGKTLAAFLAAVDRVVFAPVPAPAERCRVVYVSPLKALAVDVERNLRMPLQGIARVAGRRGEAYYPPEVGVRTGDTPQVALPFFLLAGLLMNVGGMTTRLLDFSAALIGHVRGGLSHVNILSAMVFSGVSGSAVADASAIGSVLIPAMKKQGYSASYAAAVTAASSSIGPIIPPSIPMVIFGLLTGTSIGKLFLGGAIPGIMMGVYLLMASFIISRRRQYPANPRASLQQILRTSKHALAAMAMPVIIIGGISSGIVTPTESGAVAVAYALVFGLL